MTLNEPTPPTPAAADPKGPAPRRAALRLSPTALRILGAVALSVGLIWGAAAFHRPPPPPSPTTPGLEVGAEHVLLTPDAPPWKAIRLAKVDAATTRWTEAVPARVRIDETRAAKVGSPVAGRVSRIYVELGQTVRAGDPLFSVASPDVATMRAEGAKASLELSLAKARLERVRSMVASRALPAKDELEADQQQRQAELARDLAVSKLASVKIGGGAYNEFTVVAPRDGVVVEKGLLPAQQIGPDLGTITLADLSTVWVVAELFEEDVGAVAVGTKAVITSPSVPDLSLDAVVDMVSAVVDPVRHTLPVRVQLDNERRLLKPNVFAQMRFAQQAPPGSCTVSATALIADGPRQYVFVQAEQGRVVRREVTAGSVHQGRALIVAGLTPGESVVEQGAILLENQIALAR